MKPSDRAGPTTCSVTLFILMSVISQGMTVDNIAARADQLGPTFIEVGITETIKPTSTREIASPGGPETGGEIVWAYGEIGALPAPGKPTAVMRQGHLMYWIRSGRIFRQYQQAKRMQARWYHGIHL